MVLFTWQWSPSQGSIQWQYPGLIQRPPCWQAGWHTAGDIYVGSCESAQALTLAVGDGAVPPLGSVMPLAFLTDQQGAAGAIRESVARLAQYLASSLEG